MAIKVPDFEDLTTCSICLETFTRPKVLPCQHSYCYACLMLLSKDESTITCPYCQKEHQITASGVVGFMDHLLLNDLVGMSPPKTEVCTDCKGRPSVDECEHCGQRLCHKCPLEHTKLSMELSFSIGQLKDDLTATKMNSSQESQVKLETLRASLESERTKMTETLRSEALSKLIEAKRPLERANSMDTMMRMITDFYEILGSDEKDTKSEDYISETLRKIRECTTVDSLKDMKNKVTDFETILRLIQTKNEDFKFDYSTSWWDGAVEVEFRQAVLNLRGGTYKSTNVVELITQFVQEKLMEDLGTTCQPRVDYVTSMPSELRDDHLADTCKPRTDPVTDTCQPRVHVTTTCQPHVDHVATLSSPQRTVDAKTETEERFLEPKPKGKKKRKKKSGQNDESKHSAVGFSRKFPYEAVNHHDQASHEILTTRSTR